ncbi:MAG: acyltransferase [Akkermansiaceae bacterium]|nr:acyltransferase [Akkermansiaceae bacterium]MCF7732145.1 acyltransferase [Akkermansiaceae bacterium]
MPHPSTVNPAPAAVPRLLFLDALRAVASLTILWHHFSLYPPLRDQAAPILGPVLDWFQHHARATQVFFVVGGYVMARSMAHRRWDLGEVGRFIRLRYCRLGLPYLAAIMVVIPVCMLGRGWLPDAVVGPPPTVPQLLAHLVFLQDILGYEQLSAGLWFVCINFQMGLIYVATLWLRDRLGRPPNAGGGSWLEVPNLIGWALAVFSLFYFNLHEDWDYWALYFFPYFFMGVVVHGGQRSRSGQVGFWCYQLLLAAALLVHWRWRLVSALVVGLLLFAAEKSGVGARWPRNRIIAGLGRASYSLFLIHFPMLLLVSTVWAWLGWTSPWAAVAGLLAAFFLSVASAMVFHRWVEVPAGRLARGARQAGAGN